MTDSKINRDELGERIRKSREKMKLTQEGLAERIGITNAAISNYETGKKPPGLETLVRIAEELRVSIDWLLGYDCNYLNMEALWTVLDQYEPNISFNEEDKEPYAVLKFNTDNTPKIVPREITQFIQSYNNLHMLRKKGQEPNEVIEAMERAIKDVFKNLPGLPDYHMEK